MATPLNDKLPVFICSYPEPKALAVDAMSVDWEWFGVAYIFPPTGQVRDVLTKFRGMNLTLVLIAPWWPNQSWFPDLLDLSIRQPLELPVSRDPLTQTVKRNWEHSNPKC